MKIAVLISGIPRGFSSWQFLKNLPANFFFYISFEKEDLSDRFFNPNVKDLQLDEIVKSPQVKLLEFNSVPFDKPPGISKRERNTIAQWARIHSLFTQVPNDYDLYIRCRPDILFDTSVENFISLCNQVLNDNEIAIPNGFDMFNSSVIPETLHSICINDQIAFAKYNTFKIYCETLNYGIKNKENELEQPEIFSEVILGIHLEKNGICVKRVPLEYKLNLSSCFTIAICGDSGSGKSTLANLLQKVLPFDKSLLMETDRYHKWERGAPEYKTWTHLNPEANNLEKMADDAYRLNLGQDIFSVDYDHHTGKFTSPQQIQSSPFVIFCGLHTLYKDKVRDLCDLKIYLDTPTELKTGWKITRDVKERGARPEDILKSISSRKTDFQTFIAPQKEYANIILRYLNIIQEDFEIINNSTALEIEVLDSQIVDIIDLPLTPFFTERRQIEKGIYYRFNSPVSKEKLELILERLGHPLAKTLEEDLNGLIQFFFILLTWKR